MYNTQAWKCGSRPCREAGGHRLPHHAARLLTASCSPTSSASTSTCTTTTTYTLAEIGEMNGISRQGVWEIVRRAEQIMRRHRRSAPGLVARRRGAPRGAEDASRAALTPLLRQRRRGRVRRRAAARSTRLHALWTTDGGTPHWRLKAFPKSSRPHSRSSAARAASRSRT